MPKLFKFKVVQVIRTDGYVLRRVQGSLMLLRVEEGDLLASAQNAYITYGLREPTSTRIYTEILKRGMRVVDVGAHVGYYTLLASKRVGDKGMVYAFEPNPYNFAILKYNVNLNTKRNIKLYNLALGDQEGEILFCHDVKRSNLSRIIFDNKECYGRTIRVRQTTLDNIIGDETVDVIRMDVEGYEYRILKGAKKILSSQDKL